ncbi:hypothetical protein ACFSKI_06115 [Pseudogracilibacillus auburnensis]|uniref:Uncharacterized protein n=1 Tax=Pseudogracilibacillus auburnensis TaxID=1494959 RepID=A0A2V3W0Q2_9BACI|nr:hypothetical protein [Pseudogracilibacillus auburnensis]PXW87480.1 hypothetical protein DFR56_105122 [Pseudogracilibacillus auburnensis]
MSEYKTFLQERDRIDFLVQKEYKITNVTESLNGAFVELENVAEDEKEMLHIITPEGRKYFAVVLIQQQKAGA